jgi:membrane-associated phospholipid phosphatase
MQKQKDGKPPDEVQDAEQTTADKETVPPSKQRYRTRLFQAGLILAIIAFVVLAIFAKSTPYFPIDLIITKALQSVHEPAFKLLMNMISWAGYFPQSGILTLLIIGLLYLYGFYWEAVLGIIAAVFNLSLNILVKVIVHRVRPSANLIHVVVALNSYSFPSGHVMFYTGFFGFIWFLIFSLRRKSVIRSLLLAVFGILIGLIGISRVYLGEHWTSDVVGGYLLGILTLTASILVYRWGEQRFFPHQPPTGEGNAL